MHCIVIGRYIDQYFAKTANAQTPTAEAAVAYHQVRTLWSLFLKVTHTYLRYLLAFFSSFFFVAVHVLPKHVAASNP
jgi:hypothetical protein